jgi:ribosomal protein S18 acetylase RimI-like enzyme
MAFLLPNGNPSQLFEPGCAQLRMVGVHPGAAGKGIGRKLTQMAIEYARQSGEKTLALHTTEFMGAARHIYKSLGFKVFRELEPLYGMGNWIYRLDL